MSLVEADDDLSEGSGPNVHLQSRVRFRRPATGVSGAESLSDSDESRLSPARGPLGRGEASREEKADELDCSDGDATDGDDGMSEDDSEEELVAMGKEPVDDSDSEGVLTSIDATVEPELADDSRSWISECAMVYFDVLISSSSGVRNDTFFSAGKKGRTGAILRGIKFRAGLLLRIEVRLCGCL